MIDRGTWIAQLVRKFMLHGQLKHAGRLAGIYEPHYEKTGFLHMQKQRRRSASR